MPSIGQELNTAGFSGKQERALIQICQDLKDQIAALAAKLDLDAGVTDTNYAATLAARTSAFKD